MKTSKGVDCDVQCLCYSVSASESDSDDSDKGNSFMQDESQMTTVKEEEILTADSGESTAGEDDFNPFGNSGSEDEGNVLSTLYLRLTKNPRIRPKNTLSCIETEWQSFLTKRRNHA